MNLLPIINAVHEKLLKTSGVMAEPAVYHPPASEDEIKRLTEQIGYPLPPALISVLTRESDGINFAWSAPPHVFGESCRRGSFNLLSFREISMAVKDLRLEAEEAEKQDLGHEEGFGALIRDWPYWIPVFQFSAGDYFCFDIRAGRENYPLVFLEHDVMDGGPNVHGLKIASNFEELIAQWSKISFVDLYDWTMGVDSNGINPDLTIFDQIKNGK